MNGYVSRPRLVAVAVCLTVLVFAGVGYSEGGAEVCLGFEEIRDDLEDFMARCTTPALCAEGQELLDSVNCSIVNCWDAVDGVCSIAAV